MADGEMQPAFAELPAAGRRPAFDPGGLDREDAGEGGGESGDQQQATHHGSSFILGPLAGKAGFLADGRAAPARALICCSSQSGRKITTS